MRWLYPVHDEDPVDVEPLLQQSSGDGHRVEVAETPGAAATHGETHKVNNGGPELVAAFKCKTAAGCLHGGALLGVVSRRPDHGEAVLQGRQVWFKPPSS